jgi:hypothetical protein
MGDYVVFRKIILETVQLPRTFQSLDLLKEGTARGERVILNRIAEPDLVPQLLAIPDVRRVLLEELRQCAAVCRSRSRELAENLGTLMC